MHWREPQRKWQEPQEIINIAIGRDMDQIHQTTNSTQLKANEIDIPCFEYSPSSIASPIIKSVMEIILQLSNSGQRIANSPPDGAISIRAP